MKTLTKPRTEKQGGDFASRLNDYSYTRKPASISFNSNILFAGCNKDCGN